MHSSVWFVKNSGLLPVLFGELERAEQTYFTTLKLVSGCLSGLCIAERRAAMAKGAKLDPRPREAGEPQSRLVQTTRILGQDLRCLV